MKILSHEIIGDYLHVMTDNQKRPLFIYKKDKFRNGEELKKEINKSIQFENNLNFKVTAKINKIVEDITKENAGN